MKTETINVYKFDELSEEAKQVAINAIRSRGIDTDHIYDEAYETVKKFNEIFGIKEDSRSWLDFYLGNINDNILSLKGQRLRTYIVNNFGDKIVKGKYFSLWSKTEMSYKHYKDGYPVLKIRYSKVIFERSCPLTGVCYDDSILQPVYEFIDWNLRPDYNSYMDFETLIGDCFAALKKDIESEVDHLTSDEGITETIQANEYDFLESGKPY